jgi:hypothetical protein
MIPSRLHMCVLGAILLASCSRTGVAPVAKALPTIAVTLPSQTPNATPSSDPWATEIARKLDPNFQGDATSQDNTISVDPRWKPPAACKIDPDYSGSGVATYWCGKYHISVWDTVKPVMLADAIPVTGNWAPSPDCQLMIEFQSIFQADPDDAPLFNIYQCNIGVVTAPSALGIQNTPALQKAAENQGIVSAALMEPKFTDLNSQVGTALSYSLDGKKSIINDVEEYCDGMTDFIGSKTLPGRIWYRDGPLGSTYITWYIDSCVGQRGLTLSLKISEDQQHVWWLNPTDYLDSDEALSNMRR